MTFQGHSLIVTRTSIQRWAALSRACSLSPALLFVLQKRLPPSLCALLGEYEEWKEVLPSPEEVCVAGERGRCGSDITFQL